jgi:hypothetical protein
MLKGFVYFAHGDCIGADAEASKIAKKLGYKIILHPPINSNKRAWSDYDEARPVKEYLVRNHDIVDETQFLIATPKSEIEEVRSGTWATIRYAKDRYRNIIIIYPERYEIIKEKKW